MAVARGDPMGRAIPGLPRMKGHPVLGTLYYLYQDVVNFALRAAREHGGIVDLGFPAWPIVLVTDPALIEDVLVTRSKLFVKDRGTHELGLVLGQGLVTSEGDLWKKQRRLVQPAFHKERVDAYGRTMVEFTLRYLEGLKPGERRNLHDDLMELTLEIVGKTLMGADVRGSAGRVGEALHAIAKRFETMTPGLMSLLLRVPTADNRAFRKGKATLDEVIGEIIATRRAGSIDTGDLLSMLLLARTEEGEAMDEQQVKDEVMTLLLAGHETTALALSWTFVLLGRHPDVEEKLHEHLHDVLGERPPLTADLPRLKYVEAVVRESMRLYPPVWAVGREALEDLELGGHRLPKGTQVWLSMYVVQRDGRYFDDPETFRPERWESGELLKSIPKYAYFPFGGGPRLCVGAGFAMQEAELLLATLAQRVRFRLVPEHVIRPRASVTLRPKGGVLVDVERR